mmetsp:Transcript_4650/g.13444  ORF Transcript_4650/g.13444 Transcript_4650/m.13444 type:complete len:213 (-) Transcript_4650:31-669(-)
MRVTGRVWIVDTFVLDDEDLISRWVRVSFGSVVPSIGTVNSNLVGNHLKEMLCSTIIIVGFTILEVVVYHVSQIRPVIGAGVSCTATVVKGFAAVPFKAPSSLRLISSRLVTTSPSTKWVKCQTCIIQEVDKADLLFRAIDGDQILLQDLPRRALDIADAGRFNRLRQVPRFIPVNVVGATIIDIEDKMAGVRFWTSCPSDRDWSRQGGSVG